MPREYKDPQPWQDFLRSAPETIESLLTSKGQGTVMKFAEDGDTLIPDEDAEPTEQPTATKILAIKIDHHAETGLNILQVFYEEEYADGRKVEGRLRTSNWAEIDPERLLTGGLNPTSIEALSKVKLDTRAS